MSEDKFKNLKESIDGDIAKIKGFEGEINTALKLKEEGKKVTEFEKFIPDPTNPKLQYTDIDIITKEKINGIEKDILHQVKTGDTSKKWSDFGDQLGKTVEVAKSSNPPSDVVFHYEVSPTKHAMEKIEVLKADALRSGVNLEVRSGVTVTNLNGK